MNAIEDLARRWVQAEQVRKLRKKERGLAAVVAKKLDLMPLYEDDDGRRYWPDPKDEEERRIQQQAKAAQQRFREASAKANALRGALTRACRSENAPVPNPSIAADYRALCESEDGGAAQAAAEAAA